MTLLLPKEPKYLGPEALSNTPHTIPHNLLDYPTIIFLGYPTDTCMRQFGSRIMVVRWESCASWHPQ
jgi:hypothetical protein